MNARLDFHLPAVQTRAAGVPDRDGVARLLREMDRDGLYQRHFAYGEGPNLALLARFDQLGSGRRAMVVAQAADGRIVGHGEYVGESGSVEFALLVQPQWRHQGIARAMLERLMRHAAAAGEREMHGLVQADNTTMLKLARAMGFAVAASGEQGTVLLRRMLAPRRGR